MTSTQKRVRARSGLGLLWCVGCLVGLLAAPAWSHGDINEKIQRLNDKIQQEPNNPNWYFQRGINWLLNQHHDHALEDFAAVRKLAPAYPRLAFYVGRSLLAEGNAEAAKMEFDAALLAAGEDRQQQAETLHWRAQAFAELKDATSAASDWLAAGQRSPDPQPDWYWLAARALRRAERPLEALAVLERGRETLGTILLLQEAALDIEVQLQRYNAALVRIDRILESAERRDRWLVRKGDILLAANQPQAAKQVYLQAQQLFSALPEHVQSRPASQQEQQTLQRKLAAFP